LTNVSNNIIWESGGKKLGKCFRQGDICFERLEEIPAGLVQKGTELRIEGEKTGHAHLMQGVQVLLPPRQKEMVPAVIVVPEEGAEIIHPEHGKLSLEAGTFRVTRFREYQNPRPVD
jgi:hypothetical protein